MTAVGGRCTKIRRRFSALRQISGRSHRGLVREFSRKSRTRLQQTLCAMPVAHVSRGVLFITLTYPADYPGDWKRWKAQLNAWTDRLRRRLPRAAGVWKLEPQKRGAPHFHLLVVGVPFIAKQWISTSWYEVVGSHDPKHLTAGTQVQLARSHKGVVAYASKYTAKPERLPASWQHGVGRWWGAFNRAALGIAWEEMPITPWQFRQLARVFRRLVRSRSRHLPRPPPRTHAYGAWVVLSDEVAARAFVWVTAEQEPLALVPTFGQQHAARHGKGRERSLCCRPSPSCLRTTADREDSSVARSWPRAVSTFVGTSGTVASAI